MTTATSIDPREPATRKLILIIAASAALLPSLAAAQPAPNLAVIRKSPSLSTIDRATVTRWVDEQVDQLFTTPTTQTVGPQFLSTLLEHYRAVDASPSFREAVVRALIDSYGKRYNPPAAAPPDRVVYAPLYPLLALRLFNDPAAFDTYRRALADPSPGVRVAALDGLIAMRDRVTAQQWPGLLQDIQRFAAVAANPVVVSRIISLLSVTDAQRAQQTAPTLVSILDTRLTLMEQKRQWPVLADGNAAVWLGSRMAATGNAQQQNNALRQIARIVADAVHAYLNQSPDEEQKEELERVIQRAEEQLKAVAGARAQGRQLPDVTGAMQGPEATRTQNMAAELEKWIGAGGVLTQAPFSMPEGLGIKRPPPTTAPATRAATAPGS